MGLNAVIQQAGGQAVDVSGGSNAECMLIALLSKCSAMQHKSEKWKKMAGFCSEFVALVDGMLISLLILVSPVYDR